MEFEDRADCHGRTPGRWQKVPVSKGIVQLIGTDSRAAMLLQHDGSAEGEANVDYLLDSLCENDTLRAQNAALRLALSEVLTTGDLLSSGRPSVPAYLAAIERARAALQQSDPSA